MTDLVCDECGKQFASAESMQQHKDAKHYVAPAKTPFSDNFVTRHWKPVLSVLSIVAILALLVVFAAGHSGKPAYADDASPVMYFFQPTCVHCQAMAPILDELAQEGYRVKLMDAAAHTEYWQVYSIIGTPTWIAANGERISGEQSKEAIRAWLEGHGAKIK